MERINSDDGLFHDGDPFNGVTGTMVTAGWLNSIQEELAAVIEAAGLALDPAQSDQLLEAIQTMITGFVTTALSAAMSTAGSQRYLNAAANVTPGSYLIDTSAGGFPLPLPPAPVKGDAIVFSDAKNTWGANSFTLLRNGKTIEGQAVDLIVNVSDQQFTIWYNGITWKLI